MIRTYYIDYIVPLKYRQLLTTFEWQNSFKSKLNLSKGQISSGLFSTYLVKASLVLNDFSFSRDGSNLFAFITNNISVTIANHNLILKGH